MTTEFQRGRAGMSRRRLLASATALTGLAAARWTTATARAWDDAGRIRLSLPAPTGPHAVGTVSLHLVDGNRQDPWTGRARELMVSVWYPARPEGRPDVAPWMTPSALAHYRAYEAAKFTVSFGVTVSLEDVEYPLTHGRVGAPVLRREAPYPVVLYSPSGAGTRALGTTQVEDLASHGYVVVTIDHTYDAIVVEFPKGRVELNPTPPVRPGPPPAGALPTHIKVAVHRADARFVLDRLAEIAEGANPDADHHPLPAGLRGALDMQRIGMFGHSFGGCATAQTMAHDARIVAGIDLDGSIVPDVPMDPSQGPGGSREHLAAVARGIGNRPFLFMSSGGRGPDQLGPLVSDFWYNLVGWRRFLTLIGSAHGSYVDDLTLYDQLVAAGIIPRRAGTIDADRGVIALRAYIRAFFDRWLKDGDASLLDAPSPAYPEVVFIAD